jgi:hypothetical protein
MRFVVLLVGIVAACGPSGRAHPGDGGPVDAALPSVDAPPSALTCGPNDPDQEGCACAPGSPQRACYPKSADPATRGVGICTDGMQACTGNGELATWGPCTGATTPAPENCTNGIDDSCNHLVDCADATCATNAACQTGCTNGQTRACYDGPSGTEGVGACHDGMQTCVNGSWSAGCPGEQLPQPEDCAAPTDLNCNYLPGCLDVFSCATSPACNQTCKVTDPACSCPTGDGDTATCPAGTHGVTMGTFPGTVECCPCSASDCGDPTCCAEPVCAGNPSCGGLTCTTLPPSCNGQVNFDCDDFPEDCDEPCCPCTSCQ